MALLTPIEDPLNDWDNLPLSHTRIGYDQRLISANISAAAPALQPNTYERWTSASGTMLARFQTSGSEAIDYLAIGAHNLGSARSTIVISTSPTVDGTFTDRAALTPTDDQAIMFLLDEIIEDVADVKVTITGGANREVGIVQAGIALQMYQPIYGGHSPQDLSAKTKYQSTMSDTGQFLGRTIIRSGTEANLSFSNINHEWYREKFQPFVEHAKRKPFFIKWRPDLYETATYSHITSDIRPSNSGGGSKNMSVSFSVMGHADSV
jgi:hypothetical protein